MPPCYNTEPNMHAHKPGAKWIKAWFQLLWAKREASIGEKTEIDQRGDKIKNIGQEVKNRAN